MRRIAYNVASLMVSSLHLSHLTFAFHRLIRRRGMLVVVAFHRIVDKEKTDGFYTAYDQGLDAKVFEAHLISLKKHFHLINLSEFLEIASDPSGPRKHTALITIDDADAKLQTHASPLLKKHNIPAIVLAPVANVATQQQFWHVRISNLLRYATKDHWSRMRLVTPSLSESVAAVLNDNKLPPVSERRSISLAINRACDQIHHDTIDQIVDRWEKIVQPSKELPIRCTNWTELKQLQDDGLDVESHTVSHRKLTMLTDEEVQYELVDSKKVLEQQLHKQVRAIAYPQGYYNDRICQQAIDAGYQIGFSTKRFLCSTPITGLDLMCVPRIGINGSTVREVSLFFTKLCLRSALFGTGKYKKKVV